MAAKTKTKAAKKTKAPVRRARQVRLPGVAGPEYHKDISDAGDAFRELRDQKREISANTTAAEETLIAACELHKVDVYRDLEADPPIEILIRTKKSARLREIAQDKLDVDAGEVDGDKPKKVKTRKVTGSVDAPAQGWGEPSSNTDAPPPVDQLEQLAGEGLGDSPMDEPDDGGEGVH